MTLATPDPQALPHALTMALPTWSDANGAPPVPGRARVELRMHLFERCAALLLAEVRARETGDREAADAMRSERDALRVAWEDLATAPGAPATTFGDALEGATAELRHREDVEARLRESLRGLGGPAGWRLPVGASVNPPAGAPRPRPGPWQLDGRAPAGQAVNITF